MATSTGGNFGGQPGASRQPSRRTSQRGGQAQPAPKGFKALDWIRNRPTGPTIWFEYGRAKNIYCLQIDSMEVKAECYISQALVRVTCHWQNMNDRAIDCLFAMPLSGTVTNVDINVGDERKLQTLVVSNDDIAKVMEQQEAKDKLDAKREGREWTPRENPVEQYIPNLFRLPINNVGPMEKLHLTVDYIEPLQYQDQQYKLNLPLVFAPGTLKDGVRYEQAVTVKATIKSFAYLKKGITVTSTSHNISSDQVQGGDTSIKVLSAKPINDRTKMRAMGIQDNTTLESQGRNFEMGYKVAVEKTIASSLVKMDSKGKQGTMVTFVTPPSHKKRGRAPPRSIYFLLDRSGSMIGEPFTEAKRALEQSINLLNTQDYFNVCAFDHRQLCYSPSQLVPATDANKAGATQWFSQLQTERGGTDISTPLMEAVRIIENENRENSGRLAFLVLITDGCVHNEREICSYIEKKMEDEYLNMRFFNLGIGSYCNWYFLKMLALIGRGYSDVVIYKEKIYEKTKRLLDLATTPVLTNVEIEVTGVNQSKTDTYPSPIPDLFNAEPLMISTKFKGSIESVVLHGYDGSQTNIDQQQELTVTAEVEPATGAIPIEKVFAKQQLDTMTAQHWYQQQDRVRKKLIELSCEQSIPTAHTTMVCYETTQEEDKKKKQDEKKKTGFRKYVPGKIALTAMAIGTVFIVGAAVFSFGDIGASAANVPLDAAGADAGGGDFGGDAGGDAEGCCDGDCDCDCDCDADCGDCIAS